MIGFLCGQVIEYAEGRVLLAVGDRGGSGCVGYLVAVPQRPAYAAHLAQTKAELYIYSHIREEAFDLYGFSTQFEKELFLILLSVNGVGPKSALGILSSVEPGFLIDAIVQVDQAALTRIPGIGKKTAERVVLELRDVIRKKIDQGWTQGQSGTGRSSVADQTLDSSERRERDREHSKVFQDARLALVGLGYREQDMHQLLQRIVKSSDTPPQAVEDLVRTALRQLA